MNIEQLITKHQPKGEVCVSYNPHKSCYETVIEHFMHTPYEIINKEKCVENDVIWSIHLYPDTPIGFYCVAAPTLGECIEYMDKALTK